ncbi:hypothetical protein Htur_5273 (plasmid) [Haloterrigena turkmenica DSM 5511]|uniref:Uncharacterized protein n=1 Tax=Haloterrigena turkmenica (strain ATCC 51198 / DSM 5511 / JCM 9101 / NCIMB 13204 / VKM B-1734 / 4k) TaxID=543526 RepID=D2S3Q4_HALTV|nr:hypothetical protein Htur_5273 [Haloterrigena turkmenica DSM 5511]
MFGPLEATVVGIGLILLFGAKRIPRVGSALGETIGYIRGKVR